MAATPLLHIREANAALIFDDTPQQAADSIHARK